jgi:hypothetical protein
MNNALQFQDLRQQDKHAAHQHHVGKMPRIDPMTAGLRHSAKWD